MGIAQLVDQGILASPCASLTDLCASAVAEVVAGKFLVRWLAVGLLFLRTRAIQPQPTEGTGPHDTQHGDAL